ncbi:hypothetical protein HWC99_gp56 [Flavobacterium phage vB_FspS_tant8-1]|uniref:Uncharacterized protein n=1 Tax=Flavobacterium phage vB_FspS_tant8-1 TaxID=2686278 RepID=A0A6B9LG64_9CAUD|nr:hypothetical protein HWC99_gp56 [Flavobacterium phage vB_FspS_tant8-1]QHB40987.1 hypothetical protein tant81_gp056 [Flavobacterium phage vB_FspS_tant8-1]
MCDSNINETLFVDFSTTNDEFNWINGSSIPIETIGGQLILKSDSSTTEFRRGLGTLDASNNRIRLQVNLNIYRPQTSLSPDTKIVFGVFNGLNLVDQFSLVVNGMSANETISHNLDRLYKFENLSGNISLKIIVTDGFENHLLLDNLRCSNLFFCQDKVRTYFVIDNLINDVKNSMSSGIKLLEWKIDGVETLTTEFFTETTSVGQTPSNWKFAKANIDGENRVLENYNPNSFNPFVLDWGLEFDDSGSYYGGKPIGTISGSNYGQGIMNIGFEKPEILNANLISKNGAFFIDLDYTKSFKIVFEVLVNDNDDVNVYNAPRIYRKYTIEFDEYSCFSQFYYNDILKEPLVRINIGNDGFLFGLTDGVSQTNSISCSDSFVYEGQSIGTFEFLINFGSGIGNCGIDFDVVDVPVKIEIEWNGQIYTTNYVGLYSFGIQLLNLGIPNSQINTGNPSTGSGQLTFFKNLTDPQTALVKVYAPIENSNFTIAGICPSGTTEFVEFVWDDTLTSEDRTGSLSEVDVYVGTFLTPVTDVVLETAIDGIWTISAIFPDENSTYKIDVFIGVNELRLKGIDNASNVVYSNILKYTK